MNEDAIFGHSLKKLFFDIGKKTMVDLSDFGDCKDFLESYVKVWQYTKKCVATFVDKLYKVKDVLFPKPILFQFIIERLLLFESKDYAVQRTSISKVKDFKQILNVQDFGGNLDKGDFLEVRCRINGEKIRLVSDAHGRLNVWEALFGVTANVFSGKKRFYCETKCQLTKETKDVTEKVKKYFRGGTILKEVHEEGGIHFIECSKILEKVLRIPKKNSNVILCVMEL